MKGCVIKVDNKINETISCLGELISALKDTSQVNSTKRIPVDCNFELAELTNSYAPVVHIMVSPLIYYDDDDGSPYSQNLVKLEWGSPQI
jgi:hypothetical protein